MLRERIKKRFKTKLICSFKGQKLTENILNKTIMREIYLLHQSKMLSASSFIMVKIKPGFVVVFPCQTSTDPANYLTRWEERVRELLPPELEETSITRVALGDETLSVEEHIMQIARELKKERETICDFYRIDLSKPWKAEGESSHFEDFLLEKNLNPPLLFQTLKTIANTMEGRGPKSRESYFGRSIVELQFGGAKTLIWFFPYGQRFINRENFQKFYRHSGSIKNSLELALRLIFSTILILGFLKLTSTASEKIQELLPEADSYHNMPIVHSFGSYLFLFYRMMGAVLLLFDPFLIFTFAALVFVYLKTAFGAVRTLVGYLLSFSWDKVRTYRLCLSNEEYPDSLCDSLFNRYSLNRKMLVTPLVNGHLVVILIEGVGWVMLKTVEIAADLISKILIKISELREVGILSVAQRPKTMDIEFVDRANQINIFNIL